MIKKFGLDSALLIIDVQTGVDELTHWGGPNGRRNNPQAEAMRLRKVWDRSAEIRSLIKI